jgi:hypothetical protein
MLVPDLASVDCVAKPPSSLSLLLFRRTQVCRRPRQQPEMSASQRKAQCRPFGKHYWKFCSRADGQTQASSPRRTVARPCATHRPAGFSNYRWNPWTGYNRATGGTECHLALSIGDRGYVLETGRLVAEGNPEALWNNDEVRAAYLGGRNMEK